jgi:peptidoglycan/xylan/chitin deacetylase (PgdA/CDA1 family)
LTTQLVGLSFDDGPSLWTQQILDLLGQHDARATFFLVGSTAEEHPEIVRRITAEGHEIGNHTWSHPVLARDCDDERVREELVRTNDCLERIAGVSPTLFRAPHHDHDERVDAVAAALGLRHARSDVAPPDWHPRFTAGLIATMVLRGVAPGAIVALHDGAPPGELATGVTREPTVEAVATVLPVLAERGLRCVPVCEAIDGGELL